MMALGILHPTNQSRNYFARHPTMKVGAGNERIPKIFTRRIKSAWWLEEAYRSPMNSIPKPKTKKKKDLVVTISQRKF